MLEEYNKASHWLIQIIITISWYRDLCSNWPWSPRQVDNYWGHWIRCVECSRLYYTIVVFTKFQNNKICSALVSYFEGHGIAGSNNIFWGSSIFKDANPYQKVVGQNGAGQGISGFIRQLLPRTYFLKVIFALNRSFLPWIFRAGLKSGSAYALVDLVSLAPLWIVLYTDI